MCSTCYVQVEDCRAGGIPDPNLTSAQVENCHAAGIPAPKPHSLQLEH